MVIVVLCGVVSCVYVCTLTYMPSHFVNAHMCAPNDCSSAFGGFVIRLIIHIVPYIYIYMLMQRACANYVFDERICLFFFLLENGSFWKRSLRGWVNNIQKNSGTHLFAIPTNAKPGASVFDTGYVCILWGLDSICSIACCWKEILYVRSISSKHHYYV